MNRRELIALGAVLALGCSDDDELPSEELVFRPDAPPVAASLGLRATHLRGGRAVFELVGTELEDIYAIAFRLAYDPKVLGFRDLTRKEAWAAAPELRVLAREGRPGLLVAALTRVGKQLGVSGRGAALAEISFELLGRRASRLDFVATHSRVFAASDGRLMSAEFVGGRLERG